MGANNETLLINQTGMPDTNKKKGLFMKTKLLILSTLLILIANTTFSMYKQFNDRSMWYYNSPTPSAMLLISGNGNVGIGSSAPSTKLEVAGTISANALQINGTVSSNAFVGNGTGLTNLPTVQTANFATTANIAQNIVNAVSSNAVSSTLGLADSVIFSNASATDITLTLPTAASAIGRSFYIAKTDSSSHKVIIDANGSTIDGYSTYELWAYNDSVTVLSNGTKWFIKDK